MGKNTKLMIKYTPESSLLSSSGVTDVGIDP
jgi:hypothetical protein